MFMKDVNLKIINSTIATKLWTNSLINDLMRSQFLITVLIIKERQFIMCYFLELWNEAGFSKPITLKAHSRLYHIKQSKVSCFYYASFLVNVFTMWDSILQPHERDSPNNTCFLPFFHILRVLFAGKIFNWNVSSIFALLYCWASYVASPFLSFFLSSVCFAAESDKLIVWDQAHTLYKETLSTHTHLAIKINLSTFLKQGNKIWQNSPSSYFLQLMFIITKSF
jgi:hypothetical protein